MNYEGNEIILNHCLQSGVLCCPTQLIKYTFFKYTVEHRHEALFASFETVLHHSNIIPRQYWCGQVGCHSSCCSRNALNLLIMFYAEVISSWFCVLLESGCISVPSVVSCCCFCSSWFFLDSLFSRRMSLRAMSRQCWNQIFFIFHT